MSNEYYIFNLVEYLKTSLPGYSFTCNGQQSGSAADLIDVSESGGMEKNNFDRKDFTFTIVSYSNNKLTARIQGNEVNNLIQKKYGLTLPSVTIDSIIYPTVKTWKIAALSLLGFVGNDERGRAMFSANYSLTTE